MNLQNRIAIVPGSSRGIGRASAIKLSEAGAFVVAHYGSNREAAEDTFAQITAAGADGFTVSADFSNPSAIEAFYREIDEKLTARFGSDQFDVLVNNAGVATFAEFADTDAETFDRTFNVNVKSLFFVTKTALTRLRDGGRIINLSSVVSRTAFPGIPAYAMTKGAVDTGI